MTLAVSASAFDVPGYRRTICVTPASGSCTAALEDDYHAMVVTLWHDGTTITKVTGEMDRVPWSTCPGAMGAVVRTFVGVEVANAAARGEKRTNCTHLHDLALLAARHARDASPTLYEIAVADPVCGDILAQIPVNKELALALVHNRDVLSSPEAVAGLSLFGLRDWIAALPSEAEKQAARLLQWAAIIAHGRSMTLEQHSDHSRIPANCYTFQDERRQNANRLPTIRDFSESGRLPLAAFDGERFQR